MAKPRPSIVLEGITCEFPGVRALDAVTLTLHPGEIHAITGENGAGKSTLLRVLSGTVTPLSGVIRIGSDQYPSLRNAWALGIRTIPQEPLLAQDLSIAENIHLGRLPRRPSGTVDWVAAFGSSTTLLRRVGLAHLQPDRLVRGLGMGEQQLIQTARCLAHGGSVFLFDEPTSSLSLGEVKNLSSIISELAGSGAVVVFVSHRIPELFSLCDRVSVLRDGHLIGSKRIAETTPEELIRMMVGRELVSKTARAWQVSKENALNVSSLRLEGNSESLSIKARRGEILGLAGLVGCGRTELLDSIFGIRPSTGGQVYVNGRVFPIRPHNAVSAGIGYVPSDRKRDGLVLALDIEENLSLPNLSVLSRLGFLLRAKKKENARKLIARLRVKCTGPDQPVFTLSGGNQQKVVFAKWLVRDLRVLLLDEPTRGVDARSKAEIHGMISGLADAGMAIVVSSSEMEELLGLCDRVLVMCEGRIAGELSEDEVTEEAILQLAAPGMAGHGGKRAC